MRLSVSTLLSVILLTTLATSIFFMGTRGQTSQVIPKYDPLCDVNDDGKINIVDLAILAIPEHWQTEGEPMNKSEFVHPGCVNTPWWDSNWRPCAHGFNIHYFNETLDTPNDVLVYVIGRNSSNGAPHQIDYGGELHYGYQFGVWWQDLTNTSITINRRTDDNSWNEVRIMIWKISDP